MTHWNRSPGISRSEFRENICLGLVFVAVWIPSIACGIALAVEHYVGTNGFFATITFLTALTAPVILAGVIGLLRIRVAYKFLLILLSIVTFAVQYVPIFGLIALTQSGFEGIQ